MLVSENGIVKLAFRSKDKMFIYGESEAREELEEDRMKTMEILLSCYDRVQKETSVKIINRKCNNMSTLQTMVIPEQNVSAIEIGQFHGRHQQRYPIQGSALKPMCNDTYWLSSDDINCYMDMLSSNTTSDVHMVDAGWFSHKMIVDSSPLVLKSDMFEVQSKTVNWFEKSQIFIPVNIRNMHWLLLAVSIPKKIVYYCDSKGHTEGVILFQMCRYLAYEFMVRYGKKLNMSEWKYVDYCRDSTFPLQNDGVSCGVYVCEMAKAILLERKIPIQRHLAHYMRMQIIRELLIGKIEY
jgi:Ulp1 family protease